MTRVLVDLAKSTRNAVCVSDLSRRDASQKQIGLNLCLAPLNQTTRLNKVSVALFGSTELFKCSVIETFV